MKQIEVRVVSGYFGPSTCAQLIKAMTNVPGDSITSLAFFETISRIYDKIDTSFEYVSSAEELRQALVQALLRRTLCAPILFEMTFQFLEAIESLEGIQILSRKYPLSEDLIMRVLKLKSVEKATNFTFMTFANQYLLFNIDWLATIPSQLCNFSNLCLQHLNFQISIDNGNIFAINNLLYIFFKHDGFNLVQTPDKLYETQIPKIYLTLKENARLRAKY